MAFVARSAYTVFYGSMGWPFGENEVWAVSVTPLITPLAIPQGLWFLGLAFFMIALALVLVRSLIALARGDWETVARIAGSLTQEEEVISEMHLAEAAVGRGARAEGGEG